MSYYDATHRDLKYAWKKNGAWTVVVVDSEGDVGSANSIALGAGFAPAIAYYDATNQDLKFAVGAPVPTRPATFGSIKALYDGRRR